MARKGTGSSYDMGRIDESLETIKADIGRILGEVDGLKNFKSESEKDRLKIHNTIQADKKELDGKIETQTTELKSHKDAQGKMLKNIAVIVALVSSLVNVVAVGVDLYFRTHVLPFP